MMKIKQMLFLLLPVFLMVACGQGNNDAMRPSSSGAPGDLLLVINTNLWEGETGDTLRSMLAAPVDALPQSEPLFDVINIKHGGFDKNFKTQRNIIIVKVGRDQQESRIIVQNDLWAKSQILIGIQATDQKELLKLIGSRRKEIISLILNKERLRLQAAYRKSLDMRISEKLKKDHNLGLTVPVGFRIDVEEENFIWLSQEYRNIKQGILIYKYPYTSAETFTKDYLLNKRDQIVRKYVPGSEKGAHMITEPLFPPLFREYNLRNEIYTAEMRGLWRTKGGLAMGGPFINITQLDETNNTIVCLDAFIYAPGHKKRDLLRQLEAIILSLKIGEEKPEMED